MTYAYEVVKMLVIFGLLASAEPAPASAIFADPPRSVGPNKNIIEWMQLPPVETIQAPYTPALEKCLIIALSFGIGGAPVVIKEPDKTTITSLLSNTDGLVSTMISMQHDNHIEIRGRQAFERRLIHQCVGTS